MRFQLQANQSKVARVLDASPVLHRDSDDTDWCWFPEPYDNIDCGERVSILGRITLSSDFLELETNSAARTERGRTLLASLLGELVAPPLTVHENLALMDDSPETLEPLSEMPPELKEAITAQLTSHYRKTLDEPIPMLKGLSPRQCAADPTLHDDDTETSEVAELGAFGFLYTVASLLFDDARPRGYSENDFLPKDEFTVSDFFECLSYKSGELHLMADYVRDRCMKTDITVRPDGTTTLRELNLT